MNNTSSADKKEGGPDEGPGRLPNKIDRLTIITRKLKRLRDDAESLLDGDYAKAVAATSAITRQFDDIVKELAELGLPDDESQRLSSFGPLSIRPYRAGRDIHRSSDWIDKLETTKINCEEILDILGIPFARKLGSTQAGPAGIMVNIRSDQYVRLDTSIQSYYEGLKGIADNGQIQEIRALAEEILNVIRTNPQDNSGLNNRMKKLMDFSMKAFWNLLPMILQEAKRAGLI